MKNPSLNGKNGHSKRPVGRPSIFSQSLADDVCNRISLGISLRSICACEDMPHRDTILTWRLENPAFSDQYAEARRAQADYLSEECLSIADQSTPETAAVDRLRVDTRKWYAGKMHPRVYGEKANETHVTNTVNAFVVLTPERLKELQERHQAALNGRA